MVLGPLPGKIVDHRPLPGKIVDDRPLPGKIVDHPLSWKIIDLPRFRRQVETPSALPVLRLRLAGPVPCLLVACCLLLLLLFAVVVAAATPRAQL